MAFRRIAIIAVALLVVVPLHAQISQSICEIVQDQSRAAVLGARAELSAGVTRLTATSDLNGRFCFEQLETGAYELAIQAQDFQVFRKTVVLQPGESVSSIVVLRLESVADRVTVAEGSANLSSLNVAQTQVGAGLIHNLPSESTNAALSSILTLTTPGVAADSNGVFHPLGEHAETSFSLDGQPISDQQSRIFSNQISASTIQEMRTLQGAPPAEFGDKTSLIVEATTRSGLETARLNGTISMGYASFSTPTAGFTLAGGSRTIGNFLALDAIDSHRFLDAPEFSALHARGNAQNFFDRFDWRPTDVTSLHFNLSAARSWFQVPNTYDQDSVAQDQRQHMTSFNMGLAFSRLLNSSLLLTANTWIRQDRVAYSPSVNLFSDQPATLGQSRRLTSTGLRADLTHSRGRHSVKGGVQLQVTPLSEAFRTALTDPAFNSPCTNVNRVPVPDSSLTVPTQCAAAGYAENIAYQPALLLYDLTRGGNLFTFRGATVIYEESAYIQDNVRLGRLNLSLGVRYDRYEGLSNSDGIQPRVGLAYRLNPTATILYLSYARVFLTPYNENLILSSATGPGGLANGSLGATRVQPLTAARRHQFNAGLEQQLGTGFSIQAEYFWKFTDGAYDFNTILNTPLNFPIQFRKSRIDGALVRATLSNVHGFSAFTVLGRSRSRLFSPEIGGINFGTAYAPVARPDHDQGFEQTTNVQYQFSRKRFHGLWAGFTWRFDSGLVVVSVPDYLTALTLTGDQQQQIGLYCGKVFATVDRPLRSCSSPNYGAVLVRIPTPGTYNPDSNPSRIAARNIFDIALGSDNLWQKDSHSLGAKFTVVNLMNKVALYNFLSSFSGTHFLTPRSAQGELTFHF